MKSILIRFANGITINRYKYKIVIKDINNNTIFNGYTNKLGLLKYTFKINSFYILVINHNRYIIYIDKNINEITIKFNCIPKIIRFQKKIWLTDKNYDGLPIERGIIYLWQKNIR